METHTGHITSGSEGGAASPATAEIEEYLGARYAAVRSYADLLTEHGVVRGLIGPRELPRLWERHILNSAAVAQFLPSEGTVVDVGSGAGLPGLVLAAMRPDLDVVLVEPMLRRVTWLEEVVETLRMSSVRVVRARAEELHGKLYAEVVTARAVAPLDRLAGWTLPLLRKDGVLLALKGDRSAEELAAAHETLGRLGAGTGEVLEARTLEGLGATSVVRVRRTAPEVPRREEGRSRPRVRRRRR
ncbi:16S rRNA (guanine(527)-N(7))-methyltransferase RsmG [Cellulomonas sp. APG4]|uniref:16S rRNA (guanine(527)-N(7))-methyltransferase RsmG n=1 Tax=Cellulomonas sp. APG4 TaxID=1538656 RepID=UPI00351AFE5C